MDGISVEELQLATRNHGMPLEALRWDLTPIGLHYLLTHYDIPLVDADSWRLEVGGLVERPLAVTLDELRARPTVELTSTMECAGNGRARLSPHVVSQPWLSEAVGTAAWLGTPLGALLDEAGPTAGAAEGVPLTRMLPRALIAPPGVPEFLTRERTLAAGPCALEGRAWSGHAAIAAVQVSTDGGTTWAEATLGEAPSRWAWRRFGFEWDARPGRYDLCCRAGDEAGNVQPLEPRWNVGGYANNAV